MSLFRENPGDRVYVRGLDDQGVRVGDQIHALPVLLSPREVAAELAIESVEAIDSQSLEAVFELRPEVVIVGTGTTQHFLEPELMMEFHRRGVGIEVMTTEAACRTFNILVMEEREVAALLLPGSSP